MQSSPSLQKAPHRRTGIGGSTRKSSTFSCIDAMPCDAFTVVDRVRSYMPGIRRSVCWQSWHAHGRMSGYAEFHNDDDGPETRCGGRPVNSTCMTTYSRCVKRQALTRKSGT